MVYHWRLSLFLHPSTPIANGRVRGGPLALEVDLSQEESYELLPQAGVSGCKWQKPSMAKRDHRGRGWVRGEKSKVGRTVTLPAREGQETGQRIQGEAWALPDLWRSYDWPSGSQVPTPQPGQSILIARPDEIWTSTPTSTLPC